VTIVLLPFFVLLGASPERPAHTMLHAPRGAERPERELLELRVVLRQ
jgi:hypothetical protein